MNKHCTKALKALRKIHYKVNNKRFVTKPLCENDPEISNSIITDVLQSLNPSMIGRFGSTEMNCICNYIGVKEHKNKYLSFIKGEAFPWWWEKNTIEKMNLWSGFFPANEENVEKFCKLFIKDISELDIIGSWLPQEQYFEDSLKNVHKVNFELLNPFFSKNPWTKALVDKKVVVVHPFAKTIEKQYKKKDLLFPNKLLPNFELRTVKAVQSIAGEQTEFNDWFEALESMKLEIDKEDYDICLIGAGAYGFPLAAHVKRMGKKGFHMGGSLQLLFGIRGKRWESENYNPKYNYASLINEHWVKPSEDERPANAVKVEAGCYW
jgi:hypothetical protein